MCCGALKVFCDVGNDGRCLNTKGMLRWWKKNGSVGISL